MRILYFAAFSFLMMMSCIQVFASESEKGEFQVGLEQIFLLQENETDSRESDEEKLISRWGVPGLWGARKTSESYTAGFFPFYYRYRDDNYSITHIWPLYGRKTVEGQYRTNYFLYPFFRHTVYEDGGRQTDFPWPFVLYYKGSGRFYFHVLPLLFVNVPNSFDNTAVLFPAIWHFKRREWRTSIVFPVYWDMKTLESRLWHLWPVYGYSKSPGYSRSMFAFPLLRYTRRWDPEMDISDQPADWQVDLAWPFIKFRTGPLHRQFHLFPFYCGKTWTEDSESSEPVKESSYVWLLPVFWWHSNPRAVYRHVWPFGMSWTRDGDEKRYDIAFPLLSIHSIESADVFDISVPFGLALFKYERKATVIAFDTYQTQGYQTTVRLWPVFSYQSHPARTYLAVHPVFSYQKRLSTTGDDEKTFSLGWNLVFSYRKYLTKTLWHALLGTFYYRGDEDGYDFRFLGGFFGLGREDDDSYLRLLWFLKL